MLTINLYLFVKILNVKRFRSDFILCWRLRGGVGCCGGDLGGGDLNVGHGGREVRMHGLLLTRLISFSDMSRFPPQKHNTAGMWDI